jgi:hypothetical protein
VRIYKRVDEDEFAGGLQKHTNSERMVMLRQPDTERQALCSTADACASTNALMRMSLLVACKSQQTANAWSCCGSKIQGG